MSFLKPPWLNSENYEDFFLYKLWWQKIKSSIALFVSNTYIIYEIINIGRIQYK